MEFVIIAKDGSGTEALTRRLNARKAHLENTDKHMSHMKMAAATLDENDTMTGSVMVVDFPTREDLNIWIESDPYTVQNVWKHIIILPCKIAPAFLK